MLANAVFEGGGVKAIALIGAVSEAEKNGIRFHQVAGTSSGSIVAALIAAGYTSQEMKQILLEMRFMDFLPVSVFHRIKIVGPAVRLFIKKGMYSGEKLEQWIRKKLLDKGVRVFADLKPNQLRIVASDISQGRLLVLPDDIASYGIDPKKLEVAKAVRMSTSLPYFFDPVILRKPLSMAKRKEIFSSQFIYIVDGGLLSNFPLWIFDREVATADKQIPTIGFQLVGKNTNVPKQIRGPLSMFHALFATMLEAHDERYIEMHNRFRTIKIPALGIQMTQFDISNEMSMKLFESGVKAAQDYFSKWSYSGYVDQYQKYVINK